MYIVKSKRRLSTNKHEFAASVDIETVVHIASAVTPLSRVFMYDFKNLKGSKCYYTDTDSLYLEKPLDDKYVCKDFGQFKLECKVKEAKFISSKVYEVVDENGYRKTVFKGLKYGETDENEISIIFRNIIQNISETK